MDQVEIILLVTGSEPAADGAPNGDEASSGPSSNKADICLCETSGKRVLLAYLSSHPELALSSSTKRSFSFVHQ